MDIHTIIAQRALLERTLTGLRFEEVRLQGTDTVYLGFEGDIALRLACIPDMPSLHTVEKRFIPKRNARDWHLSRFAGKLLMGVVQTPGDRILSFTAENGVTLVFEMTGRNANIVIAGPDSVILGAVRVVGERESAFRVIRPGVVYAPPPVRNLPDPLSMSAGDIASLLGRASGSLSDALVPLSGGSRLCAREVLALSEADPDAPACDAKENIRLRIAGTLLEICVLVRDGGDGATLVTDPKDGLPRDVFPLPMVSVGTGGRHFGDVNEAVAAYSRERGHALERRGLTTTVTSALSREERALRDTIRKIENERGGETEPDDLEHRANALLAGLHHVKKGAASATVPDPWGGGMMEIALDPALDGPANAGRLFTRARKLRSAARMAEERLASLERRLETVAGEREALAQVEDIGDLRAWAARYARFTSSARERDTDDRFPRRFASVSGLEIIVGRSDEENDDLIRWARRTDIWLHAQGVQGSHVILRSPGKQAPDHQSIEQAAAIAAYYSKAKTSAVVPVAWTPLKYVVKRRGQGPGQVTYSHEKVVFVEPWKPKTLTPRSLSPANGRGGATIRPGLKE